LFADGIVNDLSEVEFEANGNGIRLKLVDQPTGAGQQAQPASS
jgi:hypothetical protein